METVSLIISAFAFLLSVVAFITSRRQQIAQFNVERDLSFEGRLAEWPKAFALHGVDIEAANAQGLAPEQIAYMILSVNGLTAYCAAKGIGVYEHVMMSKYRQRMFAQSDTRKVWRYARLCIPSDTAQQIDMYMMEKHGEQYDSAAS